MADFQSSLSKLRDKNITVIAGSSDVLDVAQKSVRELGIEYTLAYGIDAREAARVFGAYFQVYKEANPLQHSEKSESKITGNHAEVERSFLQPVGFLVRPDRTLEIACYSSGHIGRISAKDVYTMVKYLEEKQAA